MMYVYGVAGGRWVVLNVKARHDKRYAFGIQFFFFFFCYSERDRMTSCKLSTLQKQGTSRPCY